MIEKRDLNLAVLIDADNVPYSNIKGMLEMCIRDSSPSASIPLCIAATIVLHTSRR